MEHKETIPLIEAASRLPVCQKLEPAIQTLETNMATALGSSTHAQVPLEPCGGDFSQGPWLGAALKLALLGSKMKGYPEGTPRKAWLEGS